MGALGGLGIATGVAGRVGARDGGGEEWPGSDDPYYAGLVDYLEGEGLPPAEFVHGDDESEVRGQYWADAGEYGTVETLDVSGDGVPFSKATRFDVTEEPAENWDVQLRTAEWGSDPYRSVEAGQVMLGVAYLRAPDGNGIAQYVADNTQTDQWNSVVVENDGYQEPPTEWQRYFFPIEFGAAADGSAYEWSTQLHFGFDVQTVDVGGIALLDFGQAVDVSELPSGPVADEYEAPSGDSDDDSDDAQGGDDTPEEDDEDDAESGQERDDGNDEEQAQDEDEGESGAGNEDEGEDESEAEDEVDADDEDESEDENENEESLPGFGIIGGLTGLGATASYLLSSNDDDDH